MFFNNSKILTLINTGRLNIASSKKDNMGRTIENKRTKIRLTPE